MADASARVPMEVTVSRARKRDFVQIGSRIFNRRHIVALTNMGAHKTVVHTATGDHSVNVRLAYAAKALGIGDFDEQAGL